MHLFLSQLPMKPDKSCTARFNSQVSVKIWDSHQWIRKGLLMEHDLFWLPIWLKHEFCHQALPWNEDTAPSHSESVFCFQFKCHSGLFAQAETDRPFFGDSDSRGREPGEGRPPEPGPHLREGERHGSHQYSEDPNAASELLHGEDWLLLQPVRRQLASFPRKQCFCLAFLSPLGEDVYKQYSRLEPSCRK